MIDEMQKTQQDGEVQTDLSVEIVQEIDSTMKAYL